MVKIRIKAMHRQYLTQLQDQLAQAADVIRREQLFDRLQEARKVKSPTIDYAKELELDHAFAMLRQARTEIRELQRDEVLQIEEPRLTAFILNFAVGQGRLKLADRTPEKQHGQGLTGWVS